MVKHDYILFDLDGTISKSADGIKYSLENAIKQMGKPEIGRASCRERVSGIV